MNREYVVKQTEKNTWAVINENEEVVDTITKDIVINYCKSEFEDNHVECVSAEVMIDSVWWNLENDRNLDLVDNYCQEFDKFLAWFDYTCIEYHSKEIVAIYKQRLLDFE